jgi:hypothetical protein
MKLLNRALLVLAISVSLLAPSLTSAPQSSQDRAWQIIKANLNEKDAAKRVIAVRVLGLLPGDPQAARRRAGPDGRQHVCAVHRRSRGHSSFDPY